MLEDAAELSPPPRRAADDGDDDAIRVPIGATLAEIERRVILAQLERSASRADAARALGIGLRTLYTKLREMNVS